MPEFIITGYAKPYWLTLAQYKALQETDAYGIYFITDCNRIYRGGKELLDAFKIVDEYPTPYIGDIRTDTLCFRKTFDDGRTILEAKLLDENLEWQTVLPPVVTVVDTNNPGDNLPTEGAIVTYVGAEIASLKEYVDAIYERMESALEAAVSAQASAEAAAGDAVAAAERSVDNSELAQSYARGGTGARPLEDTDNAKYYMEQAAAIVAMSNRVVSVFADEAHVQLQECIQTHVPNYDSDYTLPAVTDTSVLHKCVLEVLFSAASEADFKNADGVVLKHVEPAHGAAVRFTCTWSNILSTWVIETLVMN